MARNKRSKLRPEPPELKIKKFSPKKSKTIVKNPPIFVDPREALGNVTRFFLPPNPQYVPIDVEYALQVKKYRGWSPYHAGIWLDGSQGKRCHDMLVAYPRNRASLTGKMSTVASPWPNNCIEDLSASFTPENPGCHSGFLSHQEQNKWLHRILRRQDILFGIRGMLQTVTVEEEFSELLYIIPIGLLNNDAGDFQVEPSNHCGIWREGEHIGTEDINHFRLSIKHVKGKEINEEAALAIFSFEPKITEITDPSYAEGQPLMIVGNFGNARGAFETPH